jgi:hypothetical protein
MRVERCRYLPDPCACNGIGDRLLGVTSAPPNRTSCYAMRLTAYSNSRGRPICSHADLLSVVHRWEDFEQFRQLGSGERGPDCTALNPDQAERDV